jgi:RNA polymerase sigma factor, sigma-70 family
MADTVEHNPAEQRIIQGCIKGDRTAQKELYDLFSAKMFGVCLRYVGSRENAKDVLQEGFISVFDKIGSYRGEGSFEGWMRRVFVNESLMYLRRNDVLKHSSDIDVVPLGDMGSAEGTLDNLSMKDVMKIINGMPAIYRSVLNLAVFEDYTHKEIAKELGITELSSRSILTRARQWVKREIKK